jgi:hypothetical protein
MALTCNPITQPEMPPVPTWGQARYGPWRHGAGWSYRSTPSIVTRCSSQLSKASADGWPFSNFTPAKSTFLNEAPSNVQLIKQQSAFPTVLPRAPADDRCALKGTRFEYCVIHPRRIDFGLV